jgi:D-alanyl-D-alanine carboxypeptidase
MKMMGAVVALTALAALPAFSANPPQPAGPQLQAVLNEVVAGSKDHLGVLANVSAPRIHLEWSGAAGWASRESSSRLRANQPFRIASVTKVFVAAATFRLIEEGRLGLYDPISIHITPEIARILESGGYDPARITIAELLGHTSGLYDYAMDPSYDRAVQANGRKMWTGTEQIQWAMQHGKPIGRPGEKYSYADTNYVILGQIIERASGQALAAYVGEALQFHAIGMSSTYWEMLESAPRGEPPRAHQYFDKVDITDYNPSMDLYGGGGLVSTTADLSRFMRSLLTGRLFEDRSTLATSLLPVETERPMTHGRSLMLATVQFGRHTCWGHAGYWGTLAFYCPDVDAAVAVNIDQSLDDQADGASTNMRKLLSGLASALDGAAAEMEGARHDHR